MVGGVKENILQYRVLSYSLNLHIKSALYRRKLSRMREACWSHTRGSPAEWYKSQSFMLYCQFCVQIQDQCKYVDVEADIEDRMHSKPITLTLL